jgi:hypothetical protein
MVVDPDPAHFARAVTELGERRPVVVSAAIYNSQGVKIIDKGVQVDARLYERLTQHRLRQPLAQSLEVASSVNARTLADRARQLIDQDAFLGALLGDLRLREQLLEEIRHVPLPPPIALQLTVLDETRPEAWLLALRSMLVAGWLAAVQDGGSRHDMRMLAAGGLLSDIGMLHVDPVLQRPLVGLDDLQRRHLYSHPLVSVMVLERHHGYPAELLRAVLEHHECLDGSGYPRGLSGDAIGRWGRILGLAQLVATLAGTGAARLSVVLRMNRHRYDVTLSAVIEQAIARLGGPAPADGPDPLAALCEVERLLAAWPAVPPPGLSADRQAACGWIRQQCAQALRVLADTGVAREALGRLEAEALDGQARAELRLILHEAAWQLRVVARQARRRIRDSEAALPTWLLDWLADADRLCAGLLSEADARADEAVPAA